MSRLYSALLMLGNAVLLFLAFGTLEEPEATLLGGAAAVALGLLAVALYVRPRDLTTFLTRGIAVAILLAVIGLSLLLAFLGVLLNAFTIDVRAVAIAAGLVLVQLALLRQTRFENVGRGTGAMLTIVAAATVGLGGLALTYVGTMISPLTEVIMAIPRMRADSVMRAAVPRVQACAEAFARQHEGAYPASLAALGPDGTECLDPEHATGRIGRVRLSYRPDAPDASGRIGGYEVKSEANTGYERGEQRVALGDETGVIRYGDSTELRIVHGGMRGLSAIRACAEVHRSRDSAGAYPQRVAPLYRLTPPGESSERLEWLGCTPTTFPLFENRDGVRELATYTPVGDPDRPTDYVLAIRPRIYGEHGIRSLRTTARGPVHATLEDRPAAENDPIVEPCAYDLGEYLCAPEPGGVPAVVTVESPDTVAVGDTFTVTVSDARPGRARDAPYQYAVTCNYRRFVDKPPTPSAYGFGTTSSCMADGSRLLDGGRRVLVRVWIRDRAGAVSYVDHRVAVRRAS